MVFLPLRSDSTGACYKLLGTQRRHMSHNLNSLKGGYIGDYIGDYYKGY